MLKKREQYNKEQAAKKAAANREETVEIVSLQEHVELADSFFKKREYAKAAFGYEQAFMLTGSTDLEIGRKLCWVNVVSIVIGSVAMIALLVGMIVFQQLEAHVIVSATTIIAIVGTVMLVALAVAAFAVNRLCIKKAEKNLSAFE